MSNATQCIYIGVEYQKCNSRKRLKKGDRPAFCYLNELRREPTVAPGDSGGNRHDKMGSAPWAELVARKEGKKKGKSWSEMFPHDANNIWRLSLRVSYIHTAPTPVHTFSWWREGVGLVKRRRKAIAAVLPPQGLQ